MWLLKRMSLKKIIAVFTLFFTVMPTICMTAYLYNYTTAIVRKQYMKDYVNSMFANVEENFSEILGQSSTTMLNIITYNPIYDTIIDKRLDYDHKQAILNVNLGEILEDNRLVAAVDIFLNNGDVFRYCREGIVGLTMPDSEFISSVKQSNLSIYGKPLHDLGGADYFCSAIVYNNYINMTNVGVIAAYIPKDKMSGIYNSYTSENITMFITVEDSILLHPDRKYAGTVFYYPEEFYGDDERYSYRSYKLKNSSTDNIVKLHMVADNNELYNIAGKLNFYVILILLITLIISIFFSVAASRSFTRHIVRLIISMEKFSGDRDSFEPLEETNELAALEEHFNKMALEIQKLIAENNYKSEQKRIAELSALQSQINPHFIYNAIDSIKWMAKFHKPYEEIEETVYALAQFFRISLHKGETMIKVSEELEHVRCYLAIESTRFSDLFDVHFDVDESLLQYDMLKIILQPIVENSIKHGFKKIKYKGLITVSGREESDFIVFKIRDNGVGFEMPKAGLPQSADSGGGYGLKNINERICLLYGDGCGLSVKSKVGSGTEVTVTIRKRESSRDA